MGSERKVNLFVVGAMRSGTTSFMELLRQHPEIYVSPIKEPHFFVEELPTNFFDPLPSNHLEKYFQKEFPKPIHRAHVKNLKDYQKLFENATHQKYLVEGSVSYLHSPGAAAAIQQYNPQAKIIILTRDPLQRALSHYRMNVGLFREKRSFETAIMTEIEAYNNKQLPWHSYLNMSFYNTPICHYQNNFEGVLVLSLEDLVANTEQEIGKVVNFLEIAAFPVLTLKKVNEGHPLKYQKLFYFLKTMGLKDWFSQFLSSEFKGKILNRVRDKKKPTLALPKDMVAELDIILKKN